MRRVCRGLTSGWLISLAAAILSFLNQSACVSSSSPAGDWLVDDGSFDGELLLRDVTWNHGPQSELQCALRALNALTSICWMDPGSKMADAVAPRPQLFPPPNPDQPSLSRGRESGHCASPLPLVSRLCSLPFSSAFGGPSKRYTAADFVAARGRRKTTSANEDLPPGFLASRGRRTDTSSQRTLPEPHERQRKDENVDDITDLYLRGFYGSRG